MADDGGSNDRGPGLDSTLTAADIETNWDQVHYVTQRLPIRHG
jgi:hypothetical protein